MQTNDKPLPQKREHTGTALRALASICRDETQKAADRIAAARLILERSEKTAQYVEDGTLKVVFENIPEGYCR